MVEGAPETRTVLDKVNSPHKLWIYTNFDCNLSCAYCLANSTPRTPRQEIGLETVKQVVDEAVELGFSCVFFTGGEPMLLDNLYEMLAYSCNRLPTTLLTNGMLAYGKRLDQLMQVASPNFFVQVSLDGGSAAVHDAYRGKGSWEKTIGGIQNLLERGSNVRLSTTITPANQDCLPEICAFHQRMGIPEEYHIVRPVARRGASEVGIQVSRESIEAELTVTCNGVYWHPISVDEDMLVSEDIFPLAKSVALIQKKLQSAQSRQAVK